jgi:predicted DNA-binding protein (UPF0251 family)
MAMSDELWQRVSDYENKPKALPRRYDSIPVPRHIREQIESLTRAQNRESENPEVHRGTSGILEEAWENIRIQLREFYSAEWSRRRQLGIKRRREEVKTLLEEEPALPDWLWRIPDGVLTQKQREALILCDVYGLSFGEAAQALNRGKSPVAKRVRAARKKVEKFWGTSNDRPLEESEGRNIIERMALQMAYQLVEYQELWDLWGHEDGGT